MGAVYRRISDEYLDPMTFYPESSHWSSSSYGSYAKRKCSRAERAGKRNCR
ncbi:MAG: hypothetical protein V8S32_11120 [Lachnospiraceae bacterium]